MAKAKKETVENEEKITAQTSTKLNPGQAPLETKINTKVKAAKESETDNKTRSARPPRKPREEAVILITNDDGISAPGLAALVESVKDLGKIVVIAPDKAQSGMGHAITIGSPLRMVRVKN
jgi:hypothetical protein